jgi:TolB-like protein
LPPHERERYRREEKARGERNKQKRSDIMVLPFDCLCQTDAHQQVVEFLKTT